MACGGNLRMSSSILFFFFLNDTATTEIYTLSLHDALPIFHRRPGQWFHDIDRLHNILQSHRSEEHTSELQSQSNLVCRLLLEKKNKNEEPNIPSTTCIANKYVLITIAHILDDAVLKACMLL